MDKISGKQKNTYEKLKCRNCKYFIEEKNEIGKCKFLLSTDKKDKELYKDSVCIFLLVDKWEKL